MVFHESLNPEREFSLAIPLVFIAILGGTTGVVGLATVLSPQASYAVSPYAMVAAGSVASAAEGKCKSQYTDCKLMKQTEEACTKQWEGCIKKSCPTPGGATGIKGGAKQCQKVGECVSACTEETKLDGTLISCCSIAEPNNSCKTKVDGKCNPEATKLGKLGGAGELAGPISPADIEEASWGAQNAKDKDDALKNEEAQWKSYDLGTGNDPFPKQEELEQAEKDAAKAQNTYEQIQEIAAAQDLLEKVKEEIQENAVSGAGDLSKLVAEQQALEAKIAPDDPYAKLADAFGPTAPGANDTFGPTTETIRSDQAAWDAANKQAALEETIRSDQAAWDAARDARIQELKDAEVGANAGTNDFSGAQRKELADLEEQKARAEGGTPTPKTEVPTENPVTAETTKTDVKCEGSTCRANTTGPAEKKYLESEGFKCTSTGDTYACSKSPSVGKVTPAPKPGDKVPVPLPKPRPKEAPGGGGGGGGEKPGGGGGGDIGKAL